MELRVAARSREEVLENKEYQYLQGTEILDNLIKAPKALLDAEDLFFDTMGNPTKSDRANGVRFQQHDLNTDDETS